FIFQHAAKLIKEVIVTFTMVFYSLLFTLAFIKPLKNIFSLFIKPIKYIVISLGILFILMLVLSFTSLPFWGYYYLSYPDKKLNKNPEYIVIMSGSGIPSESGLIRTFYGAEAANKFPAAKIVIAMPGKINDSTSTIQKTKEELILRGVLPQQILFENKGTNTRSQALYSKEIIPLNANILIVTSPEHIYRTVKSFEKVGYRNCSGSAAFEKNNEASFAYKDDQFGGNTIVPNIGKNRQLRYQFWNHLKYEILICREYTAIAFYKLKGWI
ncbi:YdcF family protein, partial [bacterium]|nr:YdcF family protein [bacterium]